MFFINYLVVFLLCYFSSATLAAILFMKDRNRIHRLLFIYFSLFFFSASFDYVNFFIFDRTSGIAFFFFASINVSIYVLSIVCSFMICKQYIPRSYVRKQIALLVIVCISIIFPLFIRKFYPLSIFVSSLIDDFYFIYLTYLLTRPSQQANSDPQHFILKNKNFGITLMLGTFITIIGNIYYFLHWPETKPYFHYLHGDNIYNDFISILLCFWLLKFFIQKVHIIPATIYNTDHFNKFCTEFTLTTREKELLAELLNSLTYQEIADKLYISNGTVKAHFHNIFIKTETKNKHNLLKFYQKYTDKCL